MRQLALAALLMLPAALRAQRTSAAPEDSGRAVTSTFVAFDQHYATMILAALESIPASRYGFRPTPQQQSVGYIAQHLEHANQELCARIGGASAARTARDSLADSVKALWPKDTLVTRYRASLYFCRDAIDRMTDARLSQSTMENGQPTLQARWMLFFVTDLAEHYAQLASYMRVMGLVPPSALPRSAR